LARCVPLRVAHVPSLAPVWVPLSTPLCQGAQQHTPVPQPWLKPALLCHPESHFTPHHPQFSPRTHEAAPQASTEKLPQGGSPDGQGDSVHAPAGSAGRRWKSEACQEDDAVCDGGGGAEPASASLQPAELPEGVQQFAAEQYPFQDTGTIALVGRGTISRVRVGSLPAFARNLAGIRAGLSYVNEVDLRIE
jgi:hypothetical protein